MTHRRPSPQSSSDTGNIADRPSIDRRQHQTSLAFKQTSPDLIASGSLLPDPDLPNQPQPVDPQYHGPQNNCFGCGPQNPFGLHLDFQTIRNESGSPSVVCVTTLSEYYEGPPGYLHGGIIATLLDEAMSKANRAQSVTALTRQLQVEYLRPVPSANPIRIFGEVLRSDGRKHWTAARIESHEGRVLARATGFFLALSTPSV